MKSAHCVRVQAEGDEHELDAEHIWSKKMAGNCFLRVGTYGMSRHTFVVQLDPKNIARPAASYLYSELKCPLHRCPLQQGAERLFFARRKLFIF